MAERGEPLSDRELDVLNRLAAGESNKAIADELSISPYTVKTHLRNIYTKLGVSTRTEAMTVAIQQGVVAVAVSDELRVTTPVVRRDYEWEETADRRRPTADRLTPLAADPLTYCILDTAHYPLFTSSAANPAPCAARRWGWCARRSGWRGACRPG